MSPMSARGCGGVRSSRHRARRRPGAGAGARSRISDRRTGRGRRATGLRHGLRRTCDVANGESSTQEIDRRTFRQRFSWRTTPKFLDSREDRRRAQRRSATSREGRVVRRASDGLSDLTGLVAERSSRGLGCAPAGYLVVRGRPRPGDRGGSRQPTRGTRGDLNDDRSPGRDLQGIARTARVAAPSVNSPPRRGSDG